MILLDRLLYCSLLEDMVSKLKSSQEYWFRDWPNPAIPLVAAGVYGVWDDEDQFIYVGMSGREISRNRHKKKYGLYTRLASHASGRLSGDQFCVYVANRIVIPSLSLDLLPRFRSGELNLDQLTRQLIHEKLKYRFVILESEREAFDLEKYIRQNGIDGQVPWLNLLNA